MTGGRSKLQCPVLIGANNVLVAKPWDRYIRSHIPLDDLERRARYPAVDSLGRETGQNILVDQAGSHNQ
jgi:hypothetical protein